MSLWFNLDARGHHKRGPANAKKLVSGENPEQLAVYAVDNITECFLREMGRPPHRRELELIWTRTLNRKTPTSWFRRGPESEIL
jgi:hypothetical protein